MSAPLDRCPGCGVVLIGVKCQACGYSDAQSVFASNNHRCPKCGSAVQAPGLPQHRLPYLFLAAGAFALGWFTSGGASAEAELGRAVMSTAAFGLSVVFACAIIAPRITRGFVGGSIAGAFLSWPLGAIVLNNLMGVDAPGVYRVATVITMLVAGWIAHVRRRVEEGTDSSVTTLSISGR
ncbi:MAG: hypothetical protein ABSD27_14705 [Bryobacteraceae bacterium]